MRLLVVNPNTTASMTALIGGAAGAVAGPDVTIEAVNPASGPVSIESHYDEALAVPGVLELVARGGYDGYVVACFGDPGVLAARELTGAPVVGIAEAAMRTAAYLGRTYSVVTTLGRTIGHSWDVARAGGLADHCAGMHACEVPVVELETDPRARASILAEAEHALATDRSDVIVLGCAGMADLADWLSVELGVPVVEGVGAATLEVEKLVRLGPRTSKRGEFAPPPAKERGPSLLV